MNIKTLFATFLAVVALTSSHAQSPNKPKLDQFFNRLAEKNKAMGSLVIAKDGNVDYSRTIGYSQMDGAQKKPLTAANRFRIGSITKMFTAAMIIQLIEEEKLKLTDTLDKFYPQIPNSKKITIAHILSHRSGIPNVRRDGGMSGIPITKNDMLALIVQGAPDFEPDTKHLYSNSGYFLLGLILEKLTGQTYEEALKQRITSKLGLKHTYIATGNIDVSKNESLTYINTGSDWKQGSETHPSLLFGAGQIISTPYDMVKYIQALFDGKIVSKASLDQMKTMRDGDGFGMEPFTFAGKTFYGHTGGGDNYGSWLAYQPEDKVAIAYLTNAKVHPVKDIISGAIDIYYNKSFQIPAFETLALGADVLDKYIGVYGAPEVPVKFTITRQGQTLYIQPGNQSSAPLEATAPNKFQIGGGRITFEFNPAKKQMTQKGRGPDRLFTKEK